MLAFYARRTNGHIERVRRCLALLARVTDCGEGREDLDERLAGLVVGPGDKGGRVDAELRQRLFSVRLAVVGFSRRGRA